MPTDIEFPLPRCVRVGADIVPSHCVTHIEDKFEGHGFLKSSGSISVEGHLMTPPPVMTSTCWWLHSGVSCRYPEAAESGVGQVLAWQTGELVSQVVDIVGSTDGEPTTAILDVSFAYMPRLSGNALPSTGERCGDTRSEDSFAPNNRRWRAELCL